jgi:Uma2 family endonuclease
MATTAIKLTYDQFQAQYGEDDRYEFWYGEAIPRGMPTWVHGLLQQIIGDLLKGVGYIAAPEIELRIDPEARPKPDVVATKTKTKGRYPTTGLEVAVEVVSEDDKYPALKQKCRKYAEWGFGAIYVVDPSDRSVMQWKNGMLAPTTELASIPVQQIWDELDRQHTEEE